MAAADPSRLTGIAAHLVMAAAEQDPARVTEVIWSIPEVDRVTLLAMLAHALPVNVPVGALRADTDWASGVEWAALRQAHTRYQVQGDRSDGVVEAERTYQRLKWRRYRSSKRPANASGRAA